MADFKPPIENELLVKLTQIILPWQLRKLKLSVNMPPELPAVFQQLRGQRTVILANHPDAQDPYVIFELSKVVGESFFYLAARDVFGVESPLHAWFGQNLGCYSIDRSEVDREAIKMTIKLLKQNKRKIVIFPEGDLTGMDHDLVGFKDSTVHLILDTQQRVAPDPIYVLPIGIHYEILDETAVTEPIPHLESRLGLTAGAALSYSARVQRLLDAALHETEQLLHIPVRRRSISERAHVLGAAIVQKVANQVGINFAPLAPLNLLYRLRASHVTEEPSQKIDLERLQSLNRAERLLFVSRLAREPDSPGNRYRILQCLYPEITGEDFPLTEREGHVSVGEPLNITQFRDRYRADKASGVREATAKIAAAMKQTIRAPMMPIIRRMAA